MKVATVGHHVVPRRGLFDYWLFFFRLDRPGFRSFLVRAALAEGARLSREQALGFERGDVVSHRSTCACVRRTARRSSVDRHAGTVY